MSAKSSLNNFRARLVYARQENRLANCPNGNSGCSTGNPYSIRARRSSAPFRHTDDTSRMSNFKHPVLLIKGTGSAKFLHQIIDALARQLPNSQVLEMPAGHAPHIVSMDRFLEQLALFQGGAQSQ